MTNPSRFLCCLDRCPALFTEKWNNHPVEQHIWSKFTDLYSLIKRKSLVEPQRGKKHCVIPMEWKSKGIKAFKEHWGVYIR